MAALPPLEGGCGVSTVRVTPRAQRQPCVYWPRFRRAAVRVDFGSSEILNSAPLSRLVHFQSVPALRVPDITCHGGMCRADGACKGPYRSRILLSIIRESAHGSTSAWPANRDLPKLGSSCTTVVIARESES